MTELYAPGRNAGVQLHGKGGNWTYGIGIFEANGDDSNDVDSTAITGRVTFTPVSNDKSVVLIGVGYTDRDADTGGDTSAEESDAVSLQLAGTLGSFHAQGEFFDGEFGGEDADGYYVQFGYILTGEKRPYKDGKFKRVKPSSKSGAWEVVVRHEEGDGRYSDIGLGNTDGEQTTFGVSYYANNNVRISASFMTGEDDVTGLEGDEFRLRTQLTY